MILSRHNFLIANTTKVDKDIPVLANVHITEDGATIATNGQSIIAVSPVCKTRKEKYPLEESKMIGESTIPVETIKDVLKHVIKDNQFQGILEHCDFNNYGGNANFNFTDGKRRSSMQGKLCPSRYVNYKAVFENAFRRKEGTKVVLNIRRLLTLLETVQETCGSSKRDAVAFIEFTSDNNVILRSENNLTQQRVCAVMSSYKGIEGEWLTETDWEKKLFGIEPEPEPETKKQKIAKVRKQNGN